MPLIILKTSINADIQTCFDLSRDIDFHQESLKHSNERTIAGRTSGLIELDESVTWEAKHFGITQRLTSKITEFNRPYYFVDEMVWGPFKSFKHEHLFEKILDKTLMTDKFHYESPYGLLGRLADSIFLKRYMTSLLSIRNKNLKDEAEGQKR